MKAPGLAVLLAAGLLAACGGGSSGNPHNFAAGGNNVVAVTVGPGPADSAHQTFNIAYVTVTVCQAGTCATIPDVAVDTASYGLRLMGSVLANAGLTPAPMADPGVPGNTVAECLQFADGYAWGAVSSLSVRIGDEATAGPIPVQVIDDGQSANVPSGCANTGVSLDSVNAFDANGVLGVGVFPADCGTLCASDSGNGLYYTCPPGGAACTTTALPVADQVANPVPDFPTDNNGVILQLPAISASGEPSANGFLVFGIGTRGNNGLNGAQVFTTDTSGNFITEFDGQRLANSFIDSGSNGLFFPNPQSAPLPPCGSSSGTSAFYCPPSTVDFSATNQGQNGTTNQVSFQVADLNSIDSGNFAINDAAGPATPIASWQYFDWGLPFFFGRSVFFAMDGVSADGIDGPYYAY